MTFCLAASTARATPPADSNQQTVDYTRDIRPILADHCFACHGPDEGERKAGLRLDLSEEATATLESGAVAVVPGKPESSAILARVASDDDSVRMPPPESGERLTPDQIERLRQWIAAGAPYARHWSLVAPTRPAIPPIEDPTHVRNEIDAFILKGLRDAGIEPSGAADPHTLVRRLSLDLRGLPPTPDEVKTFLADDGPGAYERLVDRFLADPAYGERWARVWLDLARYADSKGYGSDPLRTIWRYRDWVIDAFNDNLPFDRFTIDQLAGDLVEMATHEQLLATAFHRNTMTNTEGGTDDEEFRIAAVKDRADSTAQIWMGLTLGCAKCHGHKYDPISQREYYQFFAFFNQTTDTDQPDERPTMPSPPAAMRAEIERLERQIADLKAKLATSTPALEREQLAWEESLRPLPDWVTLHPGGAVAESGAALDTSRSDGSIAVSGPLADVDTYTLPVEVSLPGLTALRLETLPDPGLPGGAAGRAADGSFILSTISLDAQSADSPEKQLLARYVRIELPGKNRILSLAEVQVFAGRINHARDKSASQSSTEFSGDARRAVDGNTDGHYFNANSTTHTATQDDPWWEVDLGEPSPVDSITIWNRVDGRLEGRLAGYRVLLLDSERAPVWEKSDGAVPEPRVDLAVSDSRAVPLVAASADFSQEGFPVENLLGGKDPKETGWAVGPRGALPHAATFAFRKPIGDSGRPTRLTVRLGFQFKQPGYSLGKFRLSVTDAPHAAARARVPGDVLAIVDTPAAARAPDQSARLSEYFRSIAPSLDPVRARIAELEKSRPTPPTVPILAELPPDQARKTFVLVKSNFMTPGEEVAPGVPAALPPLESSGRVDRLALARWLVRPDHPLTARVAVNRLWARIFGTGIVVSEEDFGTQGDPPTHPELLDWLATEYVRLGWDTKALLKVLVCSATYRRSARLTPDQASKDPLNRLLARSPRYRLEAEMVRDQALAIAGLLSRKMHGPSVFPPQPEGLWRAAFNGADRTWATSTGEDRYRRGIYTFWRRTIPYPSMTTFDAPSREICAVRRGVTNTPLQALVTLNDPAYVEAAQGLARRLVREAGPDPLAKVAHGIFLCLARPPRPGEAEPLVELYRAELARFQADPAAAQKMATEPLGPFVGAGGNPPSEAELAAWTVVANVLLNLDAVLTRG